MTDWLGLAGSVALVTGAASGIGRATALAYAAVGVKVALLDRDAAGLEPVAAEIETSGGAALPVAADVTDADSVGRAVAAVVDRWGRLDCAFNNAGIRGTTARLHEVEPDAFDLVMDVNVRGMFLCLRAEIEAMRGLGGGAIINTSSIYGTTTTEGASPYATSKHAVVGLTRSAAIEAAPHGIRVNAIAPGVVQTPMLVELMGGVEPALAKYAPLHPIGRLAEPGEIADAVIWLSSRRASFVTGALIQVDGGYGLR